MPTLSPAAIVVRGGLMGMDNMLESAKEAGDLSTCIADRLEGEDDAAAVLRLCRDGKLPNGQIRLSRLDKLTDRGFTVQHRPPPDCHWIVPLANVDEELLERFTEAFDEPIPNPARANAKGGRPT